MNPHLGHPHLAQLYPQQRGAVLVISLILLLVMTILAISSSQIVRMQERMAGNIRDTDLAFQSAEAGLRDGEQYIEDLTGWPASCITLTAGCNIYETVALLNQDLRIKDNTFWTTYGRQYRTSAKEIAQVVEDPRYVIEKLDAICDTGEGACLEADALYYFRISSRARGGSTSSDSRLESTYVRRGT